MQNLKLSSKSLSTKERRNLFYGLLFISPWLIGFLVFSMFPIGSSLYYSFFRYDLIREPVFIGMKNYVEIFTHDPRFMKVMQNTIFYVGLGVPLQLVTAYLMSILLNSKIVGRSFFRAIFFFPSVIPAVVTALVDRFGEVFPSFTTARRSLGLKGRNAQTNSHANHQRRPNLECRFCHLNHLPDESLTVPL